MGNLPAVAVDRDTWSSIVSYGCFHCKGPGKAQNL